MRAKTFSSRFTTSKISSRFCLSEILAESCWAMESASLPGSVICGIDASASGEIFLFNFT